jgi:hypothetical protein
MARPSCGRYSGECRVLPVDATLGMVRPAHTKKLGILEFF